MSEARTPETPAENLKDRSQERQKRMIADHFEKLARAKTEGKKVVYTFVPGNVTELLGALDLLPVLPEINALQSGMRKRSAGYIAEAEKAGHSEDVCTYVKCDIGMMKSGNIGPTGTKLPDPDLLLLSYTGCFTFMKWFELLKQEYDCPVVMLHVPYQTDGKITPEMRAYVVEQLEREVIPALEKLAGKKLDMKELSRRLALSARAEEDLVKVWESARHRPSPIDGYFGGVYYVGPIFSSFRGSEDAALYYQELREEVDQRIAEKRGPMTPDGEMPNEKYRLVVEGPPNWTSFHDFWPLRHGVPTRSQPPARQPRRVLPGLLHEPRAPHAPRLARALHPRLPGRRVSHQQREVVQLVQRGAAADAPQAGGAHRRPRRLHRVGSRRSALLRKSQHREPRAELPAGHRRTA